MSLLWRDIDKSLLEPQFVRDIEDLFTGSKMDWYVTHGFRTMDEQARLYAQGRTTPGKIVTKAKPGQSAHNYGLAIDVVLDGDPTKPGLQPNWITKSAGWLWLVKAVGAHPRLESLSRIGDWPHIQKRDWKLWQGWQRHTGGSASA